MQRKGEKNLLAENNTKHKLAEQNATSAPSGSQTSGRLSSEPGGWPLFTINHQGGTVPEGQPCECHYGHPDQERDRGRGLIHVAHL